MAERFFPQERRHTCAVASLRSVLASQFGVHVREDVLRFAGTVVDHPIIARGADTAELRRMLEVANRAVNPGPPWRLRIHRFGTIADLAREVRRGRLPLVSVVRYEGNEDVLHMVVVCGYKPGRVRYFDPSDGKTVWCGSGAFRRQWLDEGNGGLRWYAVVSGGTPVST